MLWKNCLLPLASADQARRALPTATRLAGTLNASLTLLRVTDPFEGGPRPVSEEFADLRLCPEKSKNVHLQVDSHSDPASSVASYARQGGTDAILLPPLQSVWQEFFSRTGSFLRRLIGQSPCPLWLMRETPQTAPVRSILCAVTGQDIAALKTAASLSEKLKARLFVLHVIPEIHEGVLARGFDDHLALSTDHAVQMLNRMQQQVGSNGQIIVQTGGVRRNIRLTAERLRADLVVTGRTLLPRWPALTFSQRDSRPAPQVVMV